MLYSHLKFLWASGKRAESLMWISNFAERLAADIPASAPPHKEVLERILARCYLKQGQWHQAMQNTWNPVSINHCMLMLSADVAEKSNIRSILKSYHLATQHDKTWYKAWHTWALANYEVIDFLETNTSAEEVSASSLVGYIVNSIQGLLPHHVSWLRVLPFLSRVLQVDCFEAV